MIFEVYRVQPATEQYVNGVQQLLISYARIDGKGKYVKFDATNASWLLVGDQRVETEYYPYIVNSTLKALFSLSALPTELFLPVGESLYITTITTGGGGNSIINVLHYDKEQVPSSSTGFTGTIELNPT